MTRSVGQNGVKSRVQNSEYFSTKSRQIKDKGENNIAEKGGGQKGKYYD